MKEVTQVAEITISYRPSLAHKPIITFSLDAFAAVKDFFKEDFLHLQEQFVVMFLNRVNRVSQQNNYVTINLSSFLMSHSYKILF